MSDEKTCPSCAETVKAAATRCRFCGHDFTGRASVAAPPPIAPPAPAAKRGGLSCIGVIIGLAIVVFMLSKCGEGVIAEQDAQTARLVSADSAPGTQVSARELFRAYAANEAAAQEQYGNRILDVTGTVDSVNLDLTNEPVVRLETDNQFMSAMVNLIDSEKPKAAGLSKGQTIMVRCAGVNEIIGSPALQDCAIIK